MQDFRRLKVWGRAHEHAVDVRKATRSFPRAGYASLKSQVTRSAESIVFNIVEGCGSGTQTEFARFLTIAIKSAFELESQVLLARDYDALEEVKAKQLADETTEIRRMLYGLRARVIDSGDDTNPND